MTIELTYTKETTYEFEYNGNVFYEHHYIDNIENRRYRLINDDWENYKTPNSLSFKGTGKPHQIIKTELLAKKLIDGGYGVRAELLYLLPDVNRKTRLKYYDDGSWTIEFLSNII